MEFHSIPEGMHVILELPHISKGFLGGAVAKNLPANAGDTRDVGSIPGLRRFPGGGNSNTLQYSCLENPTDGRAWRVKAHGFTKSQT